MNKFLFSTFLILLLLAGEKWMRTASIEKERKTEFKKLGYRDENLGRFLGKRKLKEGEVYYLSFKGKIREGEAVFYFTEKEDVRVFFSRSKNGPWVDVTSTRSPVFYAGDRGGYVRASKDARVKFYLQ